MPEYVPWNWVIASSISNVPVAVALQPLIIIDDDIVIVNVPVEPIIVPDIEPTVRPPIDIVAENVLPVCVTDHVAPELIEVPLPIIEPLESEAPPTHVPVRVLDDVGVEGEDIMLPPPQAAASTVDASIRRPRYRMVITPLSKTGPRWSDAGPGYEQRL